MADEQGREAEWPELGQRDESRPVEAEEAVGRVGAEAEGLAGAESVAEAEGLAGAESVEEVERF